MAEGATTISKWKYLNYIDIHSRNPTVNAGFQVNISSLMTETNYGYSVLLLILISNLYSLL